MADDWQERREQERYREQQRQHEQERHQRNREEQQRVQRQQYWCPIKHALRLKTAHSRYQHFLDYGDAEQYRARLEAVRREFEDIDSPQGKGSDGVMG